MVLLAALFLSLVLLVSLANVLLLRVPPKKLPALLRTLFAQPPPPAAPGKVDGGPPPPPPQKKQQQKKKERRGVSAELRRVFATFDKNGDGLITREELRESLRGLQISVSDEEVEEAVAGSDANGDGRIDLDEFCGLLESMSAVGSAVGSSSSDRSLGDGECGGEEAELKEAFDVFDRNGDGVITVEELEGVLSSLGMSEGKRAKACEEMIRKVDVDGDGMVNFDEFKRMMRGGQALLVSA